MRQPVVQNATVDRDRSERIALEGAILRCGVGPAAHGLAREGEDDREELVIAIEPPCLAIGLERWERHVDRPLVAYSLRTFVMLALQGNATALIALYSPAITVESALGRELRELAPAFISSRLADRYAGYLRAQKDRLLGTRYDVAYAMNVLRFAEQGRELLESGELVLPVPEPARGRIIEVRDDHLHRDSVLARVEEAERMLERARYGTLLPDEPDTARIETWMVEAYGRYWSGER